MQYLVYKLCLRGSMIVTIKPMYSKEQIGFIPFSSSLGVKHKSCFPNSCFQVHPQRYNMFDLTEMRSSNITEKKRFKTDNIEDTINTLKIPFITHDILVCLPTTNVTYCSWQHKNEKNSIDKFLHELSSPFFWDFVAQKAIDFSYKRCLLKVRTGTLMQYKPLFVPRSFFNHGNIYENTAWMFALLVVLLRIFTSYRLLQKQLYIHSEYVDMVCSLFKNNCCSKVIALSYKNCYENI